MKPRTKQFFKYDASVEIETLSKIPFFEINAFVLKHYLHKKLKLTYFSYKTRSHSYLFLDLTQETVQITADEDICIAIDDVHTLKLHVENLNARTLIDINPDCDEDNVPRAKSFILSANTKELVCKGKLKANTISITSTHHIDMLGNYYTKSLFKLVSFYSYLQFRGTASAISNDHFKICAAAGIYMRGNTLLQTTEIEMNCSKFMGTGKSKIRAAKGSIDILEKLILDKESKWVGSDVSVKAEEIKIYSKLDFRIIKVKANETTIFRGSEIAITQFVLEGESAWVDSDVKIQHWDISLNKIMALGFSTREELWKLKNLTSRPKLEFTSMKIVAAVFVNLLTHIETTNFNLTALLEVNIGRTTAMNLSKTRFLALDFGLETPNLPQVMKTLQNTFQNVIDGNFKAVLSDICSKNSFIKISNLGRWFLHHFTPGYNKVVDMAWGLFMFCSNLPSIAMQCYNVYKLDRPLEFRDLLPMLQLFNSTVTQGGIMDMQYHQLMDATNDTTPPAPSTDNLELALDALALLPGYNYSESVIQLSGGVKINNAVTERSLVDISLAQGRVALNLSETAYFSEDNTLAIAKNFSVEAAILKQHLNGIFESASISATSADEKANIHTKQYSIKAVDLKHNLQGSNDSVSITATTAEINADVNAKQYTVKCANLKEELKGSIDSISITTTTADESADVNAKQYAIKAENLKEKLKGTIDTADVEAKQLNLSHDSDLHAKAANFKGDLSHDDMRDLATNTFKGIDVKESNNLTTDKPLVVDFAPSTQFDIAIVASGIVVDHKIDSDEHAVSLRSTETNLVVNQPVSSKQTTLIADNAKVVANANIHSKNDNIIYGDKGVEVNGKTHTETTLSRFVKNGRGKLVAAPLDDKKGLKNFEEREKDRLNKFYGDRIAPDVPAEELVETTTTLVDKVQILSDSGNNHIGSGVDIDLNHADILAPEGDNNLVAERDINDTSVAEPITKNIHDTFKNDHWRHGEQQIVKSHTENTAGAIVENQISAKGQTTLATATGDVNLNSSHVHSEEKLIIDAHRNFNMNNSLADSKETIAHTHTGDIVNNNGTISGSDYTEVDAAGNVILNAGKTDYQDRYGDRRRWTPAVISGGAGRPDDPEEVKLGLVVHAHNQVLNNASVIKAIGDTKVEGDKGVIGNPEAHRYVSDRNHDSGFLGIDESDSKTLSWEVQKPVISSTHGRNHVGTTEGELDLTATDLLSQLGTDLSAQNANAIKLLDLVTDTETVSTQSNWFGLSTLNSDEVQQISIPTVMANVKPGINTFFTPGDFTSRGTLYFLPGETQFKIGGRADFSPSILNHTLTQESSGLTLSVWGTEIIGPPGSSGCHFSFQDPLINHFDQLANSDNFAEFGINGASTLASGINTEQDIFNALQNHDLLNAAANRYGVPFLSDPNITVGYTQSKSKMTSQSAAAGGLYTNKLIFDVNKQILLEGVPFYVTDDMELNTPLFVQSGVNLQSSFTTKQNSVTATPSADHYFDVGASTARSNAKSSLFLNQHLYVGGTLNANIDTWIQDGAKANLNHIKGSVNKLIARSHTNQSQQTSESMSACTNGNFSYQTQHDESVSVAERSGISVLTDSKDDFHLHSAVLTEADITRDGKVNFTVDNVERHSINTHRNSNKHGLSASVSELQRAYQAMQPRSEDTADHKKEAAFFNDTLKQDKHTTDTQSKDKHPETSTKNSNMKINTLLTDTDELHGTKELSKHKLHTTQSVANQLKTSVQELSQLPHDKNSPAASYLIDKFSHNLSKTTAKLKLLKGTNLGLSALGVAAAITEIAEAKPEDRVKTTERVGLDLACANIAFRSGAALLPEFPVGTGAGITLFGFGLFGCSRLSEASIEKVAHTLNPISSAYADTLDKHSSLLVESAKRDTSSSDFNLIHNPIIFKIPSLYESIANTYPTLYRGDTTDYKQIFHDGFTARGTNMDFADHSVKSEKYNSAYIATSLSKGIASQFPIEPPRVNYQDANEVIPSYIYEIHTNRTPIDIAGELSTQLEKFDIDPDEFNIYRYEQEMAFQSRIEPHEIKGCWISSIRKEWDDTHQPYNPKLFEHFPDYTHTPTKIFIPNLDYVPPTAPGHNLWKTGAALGHTLTAVSAVIDGGSLLHEIKTSMTTGNFNNTYQEESRIAGGWSGAWSLGRFFGAIGTLACAPFTPPVAAGCGIVGGIAGSIVGYQGGETAALKAWEAIKNDSSHNLKNSR